MRYALVAKATAAQIEPYLPSNYIAYDTAAGAVIEGEDSCGWTLDDYVIPRLASGLYFGIEIDAPDPACNHSLTDELSTLYGLWTLTCNVCGEIVRS